jgi:hypothetical protein
MVMISNAGIIDFSFIPSLECNISCPFCMYNADPDNKLELNLEQTTIFTSTINWSLINSVGFYGGEPSINISLYQKFIDLVPIDIPKFIISNGVWSKELYQTIDFLNFLKINRLHLVVSGTPYHKKFQNVRRLEIIKDLHPEAVTLKGDDKIHPMGRAYIKNWSCSKKCQDLTKPIRLGLFPNGDILFQNCDGVYPIVQTYFESFVDIIEKVNIIKSECVHSQKG